MAEFILNIFFSATIISVALWVSKSNAELGGFMVSLPLSTLIILALSKSQARDSHNSFLLAKSIFVAVPLTLLFFVPFLVAEKLKLSFWTCYCTGVALLGVSFVLHRYVVASWFQ